MLLKFAQELEDYGKVEKLPLLEKKADDNDYRSKEELE